MRWPGVPLDIGSNRGSQTASNSSSVSSHGARPMEARTVAGLALQLATPRPLAYQSALRSRRGGPGASAAPLAASRASRASCPRRAWWTLAVPQAGVCVQPFIAETLLRVSATLEPCLSPTTGYVYRRMVFPRAGGIVDRDRVDTRERTGSIADSVHGLGRHGARKSMSVSEKLADLS